MNVVGVNIKAGIPSAEFSCNGRYATEAFIPKYGLKCFQVVTKKPAKVIVGQRLPVKFPGAVPGSSYTFVTIPALTGPPLPASGPRKVAIHQAKMKTEPVKYSVVARHAGQVKTTNVSQSPNAAVSIRSKAVPLKGNIVKPVTIVPSVSVASVSTPATLPSTIATSSVIIHKLWNETVAEMSAVEPKVDKKDNST